jgi:hypothetical protein
MNTPINVPNLAIEDQGISKVRLETFIKDLSNFFDKEKIEEIAKATNFVERESKLTGLLFLSLFVLGASHHGNPTLEQLVGLLKTYRQEIELSRSGLHQRINDEAVAFFEQVLSLAVNRSIPDQLKINVPTQFAGIKIWDSTAFQLPPALAPFFVGKGGSASPAGAKIQFCYDFNRHQWGYVLQSANEADNSMADEIVALAQPGDLVLQDLGYFNVETFAALHDKGAYYLSRLKHDVKVYHQTETGIFHSEDLPTLLRHQQFDTLLELEVFIRSKHNVFTKTRLIIERLPEQVRNERLRKLHQEAHSRGRQLTATAIFLAAFNFYVTNASRDLLPASCCRFLYAIRWQVELVFKAWKSHLQIHHIHVKHRPQRVKVTILGKLIFTTLTAQAIRLTTAFLWHTSQLEISYYRAVRHFQTVAVPWFARICSGENTIFAVLQNAIAFIQQHSFKIPQSDRLYPLEKLQLFGDLLLTR